MGQKGSHLKLTDIYQLKNQTYFTENEIREFYKEFCKTHPQGTINKQDMYKLYRSIFPHGDPKSLVEQLFRIYDADNNGRIDFREFLCVVSVVSSGSTDDKLRLAFQLYDQDNNGYITKDEYETIISGIYKALGTLAPEPGTAGLTNSKKAVSFERLDSNSDKRVSFDEFQDYAKKDPKLMGLITISPP